MSVLSLDLNSLKTMFRCENKRSEDTFETGIEIIFKAIELSCEYFAPLTFQNVTARLDLNKSLKLTNL